MTSISGAVSNMAIPRLFLSFRSERKTGVAVFEREKAAKKVFFTDGDAVFASSNLESDRLGERLLRAGTLTRNQYDAYREIVQKTGKMEGAVLVELGFITPRDLAEALRLQVRDIVLSLFAWREGAYRFEEGPFPLAGIIPLRMSAGNIILEGLRGFDWQAVRRSLPPLTSVIRPAADPAALFQSADLSPDQKTVLLLIDGRRNIEEICAASGIGDFNTLTAIHLFLALGIAETGEIRSEEERALAQHAVRLALGLDEEKPKGHAPKGADVLPGEIRQTIQRAFEELGGKDHYQVLDVAETAAPQDIRKAYFRLAKLYHPDRHFDPEMGGLKGALEALFARITEAYNTLSTPALREEYDLSQARRTKKVAVEEDRTDRKATAANQFNKGLKAFKEGNFWGASEAFQWACRLDPANARYFYHQGLALAQMPRRGHDAGESFKKAVELDPTRAEYYIELGNLYLKNNMKARALSLYREALRWDPDSEQLKQAIRAASAEAKE